MNHRAGLDRSQTLLFSESLDDYVAAANPVRFLDAFVASLDLHALGFAKARCAEWSVLRDDSSPLSREEARMLWQFRQELPVASQQRFDALPVAVRRQVATLWHEVLTWHGSRDSSAEGNGLASETTFRRVTVSG